MNVHPSFLVASAWRRALIVLSLLVATGASADPRWWWHDQRLTFTDAPSVTPHLVVPGYATGGNAAGGIFVTWAEQDPAGGDLEIWMTASFNGGCSFCDPIRMTDNDVEDTSPRIAVLALPEGFYSIAIIFEQARDVSLNSGKVVVAWDSTTANYRVPQDQLCGELSGVGPNVIANAQYVVFGEDLALADQPDIVSVTAPAFAHFHAVWRDTRTRESDIFHAHDLTARGGPGWRMDPEKNLTPFALPGPILDRPQVAGDILTDPDPTTGLGTMDRSGVNVVFASHGDIVGDAQLWGLRSVDSGATFSATGDRVDGPPVAVSGTFEGGDLRPSLDSSPSTFNFEQPLWVAAAWDDVFDLSADREINSDARFLATPTTALPDWQAGDEPFHSVTDPSDGDVSLALSQNFGSAQVSSWAAWEDSTPFTSVELHYRAGMLDTAAADTFDWTRFPIPPQRRIDSAGSTSTLLTHTAFDDATETFPSTRVAGTAEDVELAADFQDTYAVWTDTRDGNPEIYFKRTDRFAPFPTVRVATGCRGLGAAYVDVTFDLVATCPVTREKMVRYFVYRGTDVGGPFFPIPVVVPHDPSLGSVITVRFDGLVPATRYQFIVVPEDEARNLQPADFDPFVDQPAAWAGEQSIVTPDPCRPVLEASCRIVGDRCPSNPAIDDDGAFDFGEVVDVEITIANTGDAPATDYTATLVVTGAAVTPASASDVAIASIPAGGSRTVTVTLQLPDRSAARCGDPVDLALTLQASDGSLTYPDDALAACDFALGDPSDPLGGCDTCAAFPEIVVTRCEVVADACAFGGPDGVVDPGETVQVIVEVLNGGGGAATDVTGIARVSAGGTLVSAAGLAFGALAPGGTSSVVIDVLVTGSCGDLLDLDVVSLSSDAGAFTYSDHVDCDVRIGANAAPFRKVYAEVQFFSIPDGGSGVSPSGLDPIEPPAVELALVRIEGNFPDLANLQATLRGPSGTLDVTPALVAPMDVTAAYDGALGGAGHYTIEVRELAFDANAPFVQRWSLTIDDVAADCTPCAPPPVCLHRVDVLQLLPHAPDRSVVYVTPRTADDLGIRSTQQECPWADDRLEPFEPAPLGNGIPLHLYQVNVFTDTLRLAKDGASIRFRF